MPRGLFRFDRPPQPEFDRWRWVDYWQPMREVIYFKRAVYAQALHEFGPRGVPDRLAALSGVVAQARARRPAQRRQRQPARVLGPA